MSFTKCSKCKYPIHVHAIREHTRECRVGDNEDEDSSDEEADLRPPGEDEDSSDDEDSWNAAHISGASTSRDEVMGDADDEEESEPDEARDPGLLNEEERDRHLFKWSLENPDLDPRHLFGAFNWSQMETILEDPPMSEKRAARHLQRLHAQGCGALGLTLRTRDDASAAVRSLLDGNLANRYADSSGGAGGSLHFFEETVNVWNGKFKADSAHEPCHMVMRELDAVALAAFLDPHAYGRQRTRWYAPTTADGTERVYADPMSSDWFRDAEASAPGKQVVSIDLFYDETVIESSGKRYKPYVMVNNHLPAAEKRKKSNWWLVALVEITTYATPALGRTADAKRSRADKHHRVLSRLKRPLYGSLGTAGRVVVDLHGDCSTLLPTVQGARLDNPEVMASSKAKHCARCETASKEQLAQHPPTRPLRDAAETQELVERALAVQEERAQALLGNDADLKRRTRRRLARLKRKLARRGLHCLGNSFFGLQRTDAYWVFTWSELHIVWQGTMTNVINQVLEKIFNDADDAQALLVQLDRAYLRWGSGFASVRGKAKARGLSALLARDGGKVRLARVTKLDIYGLALFFRPLVASLLGTDANAGLAHYWHWVRLVRHRNVETGQHELSESQLDSANPLLERALDRLKPAFPDYGFETSKFHNSFHFPRLHKKHGADHDEASGEFTHSDRKADSKASNQKNEHMFMAVRTEEREGLMIGQRMTTLRDRMLCRAVCTNDLGAVRRFLQTGVPPDAHDADEVPAVVLAAGAGRARCLRILLDAGAAIDARGEHNASAFTVACRSGRIKCLRLLIQRARKVLDAPGAHALMTSASRGLSPGQWALESGHIDCVAALSAALGVEVRRAIPSIRMAALDKLGGPSLMPPEPGPLHRLQLSDLRRGSDLCRRCPFLLELRKALHLYLANKPREFGPGHRFDAACAMSDLPSEITVPDEVTLHPGMRLGREPPPELRERVHAAPTLSAKLGSAAALHCAAFEGDDHHDHYYGMICLFFSAEFCGHVHKLCLVHWLVFDDTMFAGAEDEDAGAEDEGAEGEEDAGAEGEAWAADDDEVLSVHDEEETEMLSQYSSDDADEADEAEDDECGPVDVGSGESEAETVEDEGAEDGEVGEEGEEAEEPETEWRMRRLVYAPLPPNQRDRDEYARQGKGAPKAYRTRNFYQVMPISEILFRQGVFPEDIWDIDDPASLWLAEEAHGM